MAAKVLISFKNIRKNLANMNEPGPENSTMSAINIKWKTKTIAEDVEQLLLDNIIEFMKANSIEWVRKLTSTLNTEPALYYERPVSDYRYISEGYT